MLTPFCTVSILHECSIFVKKKWKNKHYTKETHSFQVSLILNLMSHFRPRIPSKIQYMWSSLSLNCSRQYSSVVWWSWLSWRIPVRIFRVFLSETEVTDSSKEDNRGKMPFFYQIKSYQRLMLSAWLPINVNHDYLAEVMFARFTSLNNRSEFRY